MRPEPLILASQSPRRARLLTQIGIDHVAVPAAIDERVFPEEPPAAYVERIATAKAGQVRTRRPGRAVLAADTAVVIADRILGKPRDRDDAIAMLALLSGRTHQVLTGIALIADRTRYRLSLSEVTLAPISARQARVYWDSGEPRDKAGAYAIQGIGGGFVSHLNGSYSGVMGLPLFETIQLLAAAGIHGRIGV